MKGLIRPIFWLILSVCGFFGYENTAKDLLEIVKTKEDGIAISSVRFLGF
jgi:hypothetical protein